MIPMTSTSSYNRQEISGRLCICKDCADTDRMNLKKFQNIAIKFSRHFIELTVVDDENIFHTLCNLCETYVYRNQKFIEIWLHVILPYA